MKRRKNDYSPISDVLGSFIKENRLEKGFDKVNVAQAWTDLMGNGVNNYTTAVQLKGTTLYVSLSSSVLREELSYGKQKIIRMLNEELRKDVIKDLVLR